MRIHNAISFLFLINLWQMALAQTKPLVYPFAYQAQWGLVDQDRSTVLAPSLDSIGLFHVISKEAVHPQMALALKADQYGIVNDAGEWILKPRVDSIGRVQYYAPGLAWVRHRDKYGLMDFNGRKAKWTIRPRFTEISKFRGRELALAAVAIDNRWGVVDERGKVVARCQYDAVKLLEPYADYPNMKLSRGEQVTYLNAFGDQKDSEKMRQQEEEAIFRDEVVIEDISLEEERSEYQITREKLADGQQLISLEVAIGANPYEVVEQRTVAEAYTVHDVGVNDKRRPMNIKYVMVQKNGKLGFWGSEKLIAPGTVYNHVSWTRSGQLGELAILYRNGLKGFARVNGEPLIPPAFSSIELFGGLFVLTHPDGYRGYADSEGRIFLPQVVNLEEQ